jgi:Lon protease-like protein
VNRSEPAPQGVGSLSFHDQEVSMSRYTITVTGNRRTDPNAVIGYDPPLRTFFLQAFPDESSDDLALWLGTSDREYETLDALQAAARSRGFDVMPLPDDIAARLAVDVAAEVHRPPLRHLQSK